MEIKKLITPYNRTVSSNTDRIKYIVIHYVGATGGAEANCKYYASKYIGASAHYYVGFDGEIWQSVEDKDIAWHCGTKGNHKHPECRNANSIGIELCVRNKGSKADTSKDWYFEDATVKSAIKLTKELMEKYHVKADHVIRHYDVTGKICPNPYVYNHTKYTWNDFSVAIEKPDVKSGWFNEDGGWRYYLGDTGNFVVNDWHQDSVSGKWSWFNGMGHAIVHDWKQNKNGKWFYLGDDGYMVTDAWILYNNAPYYLTTDGSLYYGTATTDKNGAFKIVK